MAGRPRVLAVCVLISALVMTATLPARATGDFGWSEPQKIENNDSSEAMFPKLAMNEVGDAVTVWNQVDGIWMDVWACVYHRDIGWGNAELIESDDLGSCSVNDVAIDANGNALAIWTQWYPSNNTFYVWVDNYSNQTGWGIPQRINHSSAGAGVGGRLVFGDNGNAFAAWMESPDLYSSRYVPGLGWGSPDLIEHQLGWPQIPRLAVDKNGSAVAVWEQQTTERYNIWSNRYTVGTGWGFEELLETNDSGDAFQPVVAVDDVGRAITVWTQGDAPYTESAIYHVWSDQYVAGVGWGTPQLIENESMMSSYHATVSVFGSGDAVAAWYNDENGTPGVWTCRYSIREGWMPSRPLDADNGSFSRSPLIAINKEGRALVVWLHNNSLMMSRCTAETPLTSPETAYEYSNAGSQHHQIGIDARGDGLIVWDMNDSARFTMYASTYHAPPPGIELTSPIDNSTVHSPVITVSGVTDPLSGLAVNGHPVAVEKNGSFSTSLRLANGSNDITIVAADSAGRSTSITIHIVYREPNSNLLLILGAVVAVVSAIAVVVLYLSHRRKRIYGGAGSEG